MKTVFVLSKTARDKRANCKAAPRVCPETGFSTEMDVESLRKGDQGYVALRAYDALEGETTTRSGRCLVLHLNSSHALVAAPPELGKSAGKWSQRELKKVGGQIVSLHMLKIAALRNSMEGLSAAYGSTTCPEIADLQKLLAVFGRKTPPTDAETLQPIGKNRPVQEKAAETPGEEVESLSRKSKPSFQFDSNSDALEGEHGEGEEDNGDNALLRQRLYKVATARMERGLKAKSGASSSGGPMPRGSGAAELAARGEEEKELDLQSLGIMRLLREMQRTPGILGEMEIENSMPKRMKSAVGKAEKDD